MARHTGFQDLTEAQFLRRADFHVEALNEALRNVPADRLRMHVCWGNYEGPHDHDIDVGKVLPIILKAQAGGDSVRGRQSPACPRMGGVAAGPGSPRRKCWCPAC